MSPIKIMIFIIVLIFLRYNQFVEAELLTVNKTSTPGNDTTLAGQNLRDEYFISLHKSYFSYLNKTKSDDDAISEDYNDYDGDDDYSALVGAKRTHHVVKDDPFPATRSPKASLRSTDGYEAREIAHKSPEEIIRLRGFGVDTHYARTKDGHYIHLVRIINPKFKPVKRPVIFNHGLFETATIWLMKSRNVKPSNYRQEKGKLPHTIDLDPKTAKTNCPFLLANSGYDVWLMSMRGTEFSLKHDKYNHATDPKFWRYSLDHFALYDIPAVIDLVKNKTNATSIGYIGHSQATYTIFALLSHKQNYSKLLKPVIAVAPVSHFRHMRSMGRLLMRGIEIFTSTDKNGPFPRNGYIWRQVNQKLCGGKLITALPCQFVNTLIGGAGQNWLSGYYTHLPYQTSLMVLRHFGQMLKSGRFSRYDYGNSKNLKFYRMASSPDHPMEKIKNKWITLLGGETDLLSTPKDMQVIESSLRVKLKRNILVKGFNHFDLITSDSAGREVFEPILEILEKAERHDNRHNFNSNHDHNDLHKNLSLLDSNEHGHGRDSNKP